MATPGFGRQDAQLRADKKAWTPRRRSAATRLQSVFRAFDSFSPSS